MRPTTTTLRSKKAPLLAATAAGLAALVCWVGGPAFAQSSSPASTTSITALTAAALAHPTSRVTPAVPIPAKAPTTTIAVHAAAIVRTAAAVKVAPKVPTTVAAQRPAVLVATRPAPVVPPVHAASTPVATPPAANSCATALAYLAANSAPGFSFECPGYAEGHQAMTCINVAGVCPGAKLIVIADVCSASYMNEASNSWVLSGLRSRSIDPYGHCS